MLRARSASLIGLCAAMTLAAVAVGCGPISTETPPPPAPPATDTPAPSPAPSPTPAGTPAVTAVPTAAPLTGQPVSKYFVTVSGQAAVSGGVFTARRVAELISTMRSKQLEPKRIRFVHSRLATAATVVLVEARVDGGVEACVEPPLILYERPGIYTAEAKALLSSS